MTTFFKICFKILKKPQVLRLKFNYSSLISTTGCDNPIFLVVPDWYANDYCRVLALEPTQLQYSMCT